MNVSGQSSALLLLVAALSWSSSAVGSERKAEAPLTPDAECSTFEQQAQKGDAHAQWQLGGCYESGRGRPLDLAKARELYERASASGLSEARNDLGVLYLNGSGGDEDAAKACELFAAASRDSVPLGAFNHAGCLRHGWGSTPQDFARAIVEYERAAAVGNATAVLELAEWLDTDASEHRDSARATELLKSWLLENVGNQEKAQVARIEYEIAERHVWGIGGAPDRGTAEYLFRRAQKDGDTRATNRQFDSDEVADGELRPVPCWFELPADRRLFCAMLDVPENRKSPGLRRVLVPVVYAPSAATVRRKHPLVILGGGGPGGTLLEDRDAVDSVLAQVGEVSASGYDVILVDLRGSSTATPSLACPPVEADALRILNDPSYAPNDAANESRRCLDRLEAQWIDLSLYNTAESAADLLTLRRALGYEQWSLLGISYGAITALSLAQLDPAGTAAVVLDSPASATPDHERFAAYAAAALNSVFKACAEDESCNAVYPDLSRTMEDVLSRFRRRPLQRVITHPYRAKPVRLIVDDASLSSLVFEMMYTAGELTGIPRLIHATAAGSYDVLDLRLSANVLGPQLSPTVTEGLYWSTWCPEQAKRGAKPEAALIATSDGRLAPAMRWLYGVWPKVCDARFTAPPSDFLAGSVEAPILVMHGEFDPTTPLASRPLQGIDAAVVWSGVLDNASHNVLAESTCAEQVVVNFLHDPLRDPWGLACVRRGPPLRWQGVPSRRSRPAE